MKQAEQEEETLKDEMTRVIEEARMVLPGIQALFGFQMIAIFNDRFDAMADFGKLAHVAALGLVVVAIALIMTPPAYHRIAEPGQVSRRMVATCSRLLTSAMLPLALAIPLEVYAISLLALGHPDGSLAAAVCTFCLLAGLWFAFPLWRRGRC